MNNNKVESYQASNPQESNNISKFVNLCETLIKIETNYEGNFRREQIHSLKNQIFNNYLELNELEIKQIELTSRELESILSKLASKKKRTNLVSKIKSSLRINN